MAHLRILQVAKDGQDIEKGKLLPGKFKNDREAIASIKETGDYVFLPVHSITVKKGKKDVNNDNIQEQAEEE
jgi:hypothetical protein